MERILFIISAVIGLVVVVGIANNASVAAEPTEQSETISDTSSTSSADFNQTGTLIFYPNNVGPVPYLFYQDQKENTVAKALVFLGESPNNLSSWTGARVNITGVLVAEHVVVTSIAYISGP